MQKDLVLSYIILYYILYPFCLITIQREAKGASFIIKCILTNSMHIKGANKGKYLVSNYIFLNLDGNYNPILLIFLVKCLILYYCCLKM